MNINEITQSLCAELANYGHAELTKSTSIFTGGASDFYGIAGDFGGEKFRVIMFDLDKNQGIHASSAHFTVNINRHRLLSEHIEFWNSDNRFTKIYKAEDDLYLVMDAFLPENDGDVFRSIAKVWGESVKGISKIKNTYDRKVQYN